MHYGSERTLRVAYTSCCPCSVCCGSARQPCYFSPPCPRALRHPHSFPTRRSSDLDGVRRLYDLPERVLPASILALPELSAAEDRKSTRLNSSHRCISYAVFCLKKKKNKWCYVGNCIVRCAEAQAES